MSDLPVRALWISLNQSGRSWKISNIFQWFQQSASLFPSPTLLSKTLPGLYSPSQTLEGSLYSPPGNIGKWYMSTWPPTIQVLLYCSGQPRYTRSTCRPYGPSICPGISRSWGEFKRGASSHAQANAPPILFTSHCLEPSLPASHHVFQHFCYCSCSSPASDLLQVCTVAFCYQDGACQDFRDLWQFCCPHAGCYPPYTYLLHFW